MSYTYQMNGRLVFLLLLITCVLISCGGGKDDLSFTNPDWRVSVAKSVTFPLASEITLRVGLSPEMKFSQEGIAWLSEKTNIQFEFVLLPNSPGDVTLGEKIRAGYLPDIVPESRMHLSREDDRNLFVDVLEFRELIPNFVALLQHDPVFLNGTKARMTRNGELLSLGIYNPDQLLYGGTLAYRRDVFEDLNLKYSSWMEVRESLYILKSRYPETFPFGATLDDMLYRMPSWFGSGIDRRHLVYFDPETSDWIFGPLQPAFEELIGLLAEFYVNQLLPPDFFSRMEDIKAQWFSNDTVFIGPYDGFTGAMFPYFGEGYGESVSNGDWSRRGKWITSMPLPKPANGSLPRFSSVLVSNVGPGWMVYNQSSHVAEALAFLDLLFNPEVARRIAIGPENGLWEQKDGFVVLKHQYKKVYDDKGAAGIKLPEFLPVDGLRFSFLQAFGYPDSPLYAYLQNNDFAHNRPGIELVLQPGVRNPIEAEFHEQRAILMVSLQTMLESEVANFIVGRRSMEEFGELRRNLEKAGANKLVELYREWCTIPDTALLLGN